MSECIKGKPPAGNSSVSCSKTGVNEHMDRIRMQELEFIQNIISYKGKTVTIFVTGGGDAGLGFTGVLAGVFGGFVRLSIEESTPETSPKASPVINNIQAGSIVDIPLSKITAIVYSAV
jgi:hypothetical protein